MSGPIICFGQQPCGFFPKRFLFAKIVTARRLQADLGGEIVFFFHDSDHDPRETVTVLRERRTGREQSFNFQFANKIQKQFSPLYAKRLLPDWQPNLVRQLPNFVEPELVEIFKGIEADTAADFSLGVYRGMGLLQNIRVERSSDPGFRNRAAPIDDFFVDVPYEGETVRARYKDDKLWLHKGGDNFLELPHHDFDATQISPARDTRLRWMQSVIGCTHYVAGAGEREYLNEADAPGVTFVQRDEIADSALAYIGD
ncbi:MAG TPA: hypothetical protein VM940_11775 [Chthoniobacterales bacterium]|jgi:hypothetical protein|nr:hypothetical protein [Chthoniobacterales bacterium]